MKKIRKLQLRGESIRTLTPNERSRVVGGLSIQSACGQSELAPWQCATYGCTRGCPVGTVGTCDGCTLVTFESAQTQGNC